LIDERPPQLHFSLQRKTENFHYFLFLLSPSSDGSSSSRGLLEEARDWKNAAGAIGIVKEGRAGAIACGRTGEVCDWTDEGGCTIIL
jgi:hypothetical protein